MSKKIIISVIAVVLIFSMTGCYKVNEPVSTEVESVTVEENEVEEATEVVEEESAEAPSLDFATAAAELGVSEQELMEAFGDPNDGPPDLASIAETLNTTEETLMDLLGLEDAMQGSDVSTIVDPYDVTINGVTFEVTQPMYDWDEIPDSISVEREPIVTYTDSNGEKHWYEVVYVETCNVDWYQYAYLAQQAGGYLACITDEAENEFVFSLVDEEKYFWAFPEEGEHHGIKIGPVLGGYQLEGSEEPAGGWTWLTGDEFDYTNWAQNLDDGLIDKDPRDNTQPNDSADGQPIMGFGELNVPVSTWGDYTASQTNPQGIVRGSYACIIEYETEPVR
ncbi:MAG: hypothetical protein JXC31_02045 [Acholeplasmataceae bacterium]|nr:hypothetical protein [Acholeplasmataceae bacterium]